TVGRTTNGTNPSPNDENRRIYPRPLRAHGGAPPYWPQRRLPRQRSQGVQRGAPELGAGLERFERRPVQGGGFRVAIVSFKVHWGGRDGHCLPPGRDAIRNPGANSRMAKSFRIF